MSLKQSISSHVNRESGPEILRHAMYELLASNHIGCWRFRQYKAELLYVSYSQRKLGSRSSHAVGELSRYIPDTVEIRYVVVETKVSS